MDPYESLPIEILQTAVPSEQLDDLDFLYRNVVKAGKVFDVPLLMDKSTLATLFRALTLDRLSQRGLRERLFMTLTAERVRQVASIAGLDVNLPQADLAKRLASQRWVDSAPNRSFLEMLGLPTALLPSAEGPDDDSFSFAPFSPPLRALLDYQFSVFQQVDGGLRVPSYRVVIQMPTGSGKTRTAMELVTSFIRWRMRSGGSCRVVWVAHVAELCDQAVQSFKEVWGHLGDQPVLVTRVWGGHPLPSEIPSPSFTVAGFKKLFGELVRNGKLPFADLVIVDEAHISIAPTYKDVLDALKGPSTRFLGLTATPGRGTGGELETRRLAAVYQNNIVGPVGPDFEDGDVIDTLQARGVLSRLVREPLETGFPIRLTQEDWDRVVANGDFPEDVLRTLASNRQRNTQILRRFIDILKTGKQVLYFAPSVEQSRLFTALLVADGFRVGHIDGKTPEGLRRLFVDQYKKGELRAILNYGVLSMGFDAPKTDCVFIARPTTSVVLYSQMIGRGLRGPTIGGTPTCLLVDVVDNFEGMPYELDRVYSFFADYWNPVSS